MSCAEVEALLYELPLGTLSKEEEAMVTEHVDRCEPCRDRAEQLHGAYDELHGALRAVDAPVTAGLEEKVLERARADACASCSAALEASDEVALVGATRTPYHLECIVKERRPATSATPGFAVRLSISCTFCHDRLTRDEAVFCAACLAPHHADCFREHGTCAATGCRETAIVQPQGQVARPRPRRRWPTVLAALALAGAGAASGAAAFRGRDLRIARVQEALNSAVSDVRFERYERALASYDHVLALDPGNDEATRSRRYLEDLVAKLAEARTRAAPSAPAERSQAPTEASVPAAARPAAKIVHAAPVGLKATPRTGRVMLEWHLGESQHVQVQSFEVWRAEPGASEWARLAVLARDKDADAPPTSYADTAIAPERAYFYRVVENATEDDSPTRQAFELVLSEEERRKESSAISVTTSPGRLLTIEGTQEGVRLEVWTWDSEWVRLVSKAHVLRVGEVASLGLPAGVAAGTVAPETACLLSVREEKREVQIGGKPIRHAVKIARLRLDAPSNSPGRQPASREVELVERDVPEEIAHQRQAGAGCRGVAPELLGKTRGEVLDLLGDPQEEELLSSGAWRLHYQRPTAAVALDDERGQVVHAVFCSGWSFRGARAGMDRSKITDELGPPDRDVLDVGGNRVLVYDRFGLVLPLDGRNGTVSRLIFLERPNVTADANGKLVVPDQPPAKATAKATAKPADAPRKTP